MVRPPDPQVANRAQDSRMTFVLVDTDVVSYLLNRHTLAIEFERLLIGSTPMISFITIAEMYRGALERKWGERRWIELRAHLRQFAVVPYSEQICTTYAEICTELEREGRPITTADAFIAASARSLRIPLLSNNRRHFDRVRDLDLLSVP